jgi:CHAD domain-containing protein
MLDQAGAPHLPALPAAGFVFAAQEPLSMGLRRVTTDEFDRVLQWLINGTDLDKAVHETRKSIKRLRSVLRLVRFEIGERPFRAENAILRDTARMLAPIRDGAAMVHAVVDLRQEFGPHLAEDAMLALEDKLAERHRRRRQHALDDESLFPRVMANLTSARARFASWPVEGDPAADLYGRQPIRHRFDSIGPGLGATYGRGRKAFDRAAASPTSENLHEWRKSVKYLRHQMELLEPVYPEVMASYARSLDTLGETLGADHDLAVLLALVSDIPDVAADPVERALVAALAQHRRRALQSAALVMGRRAYAETPGLFLERIGAYWRSTGAASEL